MFSDFIDLASEHADVVPKIEEIMLKDHALSAEFPMKGIDP